MAEDINETEGHRSPASDIYSLARMMLEVGSTFMSRALHTGILSISQVFTGDFPFRDLRTDIILLQSLDCSFVRPTNADVISNGLDDRVWELMMNCWRVEPSARPTASDVAERLRSFLEPAAVRSTQSERLQRLLSDNTRIRPDTAKRARARPHQEKSQGP